MSIAFGYPTLICPLFQSTSSEEDVVSRSKNVRIRRARWFQSTSSEEDVVSLKYVLLCTIRKSVSIHVLRRGRCVSRDCIGIFSTFRVSIHVLRRGRCVTQRLAPYMAKYAVSIHVLRRGRCVEIHIGHGACARSFNPRPPKRTLCPINFLDTVDCASVSIHVLRRGRCVSTFSIFGLLKTCFNPRPPKRTLCQASGRCI